MSNSVYEVHMLSDIYPYIDTLIYFSRRLNSINYFRDTIRVQVVEWWVKKKVPKTISKPRNAGLLTIHPPDAADSPRTFYCTSYIFFIWIQNTQICELLLTNVSAVTWLEKFLFFPCWQVFNMRKQVITHAKYTVLSNIYRKFLCKI